MAKGTAESSLPSLSNEVVDALQIQRRSFWGSAFRVLVRKHPFEFFICGGILVIVTLSAIFAPWIQPADPNFQDVRFVSSPPSISHPFGTDNIGRDVFSRTVHGARISLQIGFGAVTLGIAFAAIIGMVSGYFGRWVDLVLQRLVDVMMAFPTLILILLVVAVFGVSKQNVILAIALFLIAAPSRVVRAEVLAVKSRPYIESARAIGCSDARIISHHIFPNIVHVVIIMVSVNLGGVIITEASLSFLGLGVPAPAPSWGNMIAGQGTFFFRKAPWMVIAPGVALALTVFAFNMLGDALRDVLDPRLRV